MHVCWTFQNGSFYILTEKSQSRAMRGPFNAWDGLTGRIIIVALHVYNSIRIDMWEWNEWM